MKISWRAARLVLFLPVTLGGVLVAQAQPTAPVHLTAEQDHQRTMDLLHITSLRRGADGDPKSPYAANYDESKANSNLKLPGALILNNGKRVQTANTWSTQR